MNHVAVRFLLVVSVAASGVVVGADTVDLGHDTADAIGERTEDGGRADSPAVDTDGDGLSDSREEALGTDPTVRDSDGDNLLDGWEVDERTPSGASLPGADPTRMDLYVQVNYAKGVDEKSSIFFAKVRRTWASMPIGNPDGTTGISLHVVEKGHIDASTRFTGSNFAEIRRRHYGKKMGPRKGVYHQLLFVRFSETTTRSGYSKVPGKFSIVREDALPLLQRLMIVHELLHNVVGEVQAEGRCPGDEIHYCEGGWLEPWVGVDDFYLPEALANEIETRGFEERSGKTS